MKVAIVGYGKMGRFYDALLDADYIVDPFYVGKRACFYSVDELVAYHPPLDLVIVSAPTNKHQEIVHKLLVASYDVLCEKPLTMSSAAARALEQLAQRKALTLYQSTLERYNPVITFFKRNFDIDKVERIESFRQGTLPSNCVSSNALFDLAIHDVDLWFHLARKKVPWTAHAQYVDDKPARKILIYFKDGSQICLDLLHKYIRLADNSTINLIRSSNNNPMLEMINDIRVKGRAMNEAWHEEIACIEKAINNKVELR